MNTFSCSFAINVAKRASFFTPECISSEETTGTFMFSAASPHHDVVAGKLEPLKALSNFPHFFADRVDCQRFTLIWDRKQLVLYIQILFSFCIKYIERDEATIFWLDSCNRPSSPGFLYGFNF